MTIQDIKSYLRNANLFTFRYKSKYYSIEKSRTLFHNKYSLIVTDVLRYSKNTLEELCAQVCLCNNILLMDAIRDIEVPKKDDPCWETYEAVRHSCMVEKNEILFEYDQRYYWIAYTNKGLPHLSNDLGITQMFDSCNDLFENARIDNKSLEEIWEKVIVYAC